MSFIHSLFCLFGWHQHVQIRSRYPGFLYPFTRRFCIRCGALGLPRK